MQQLSWSSAVARNAANTLENGVLAGLTIAGPPQQLPRPGVPPAKPPKGPIHNGHKPGQKPPHPDKGQKPGKPKPKGNGHKPKRKKK
jgi:hypothetical protein